MLNTCDEISMHLQRKEIRFWQELLRVLQIMATGTILREDEHSEGFDTQNVRFAQEVLLF